MTTTGIVIIGGLAILTVIAGISLLLDKKPKKDSGRGSGGVSTGPSVDSNPNNESIQ